MKRNLNTIVKKIVNEELHKTKRSMLKEDGNFDFYSKEVRDKIEHANSRDGKDISANDEEKLRNILKSPYLNIKQFAVKCYPDHTEEGAQSQLNKEINGDKTDGGNEYHLKERTARIIRSCLSELANAIRVSQVGKHK